MKEPQAFLICMCLLGAAQPAWSQAAAPTATAIPGLLNPVTGKFTTQIASATTAQPNAQGQAALTGTSIFFREDFQVQILNYDQSSAASATCTVTMGTYDVATNGSSNGSFEESATVPATASGNGWTCDVPLLTQWTLQNPTSDAITASITVTIYTQTTPVPVGRTSTQPLNLAVPSNGQTVVNSVKFQI